MKVGDYSELRIPSIEEIRDDGFFVPYVATLKRIFAEILGWPESRTLAWVEQRLQYDWFRLYFGHATPCDDAASVIVPASLRERLITRGISTHDVHAEIHRVLEGCGDSYSIHPDEDVDYDWERVRGSIADIVKKYEAVVA